MKELVYAKNSLIDVTQSNFSSDKTRKTRIDQEMEVILYHYTNRYYLAAEFGFPDLCHLR
jgi:hypothetical protein